MLFNFEACFCLFDLLLLIVVLMMLLVWLGGAALELFVCFLICYFELLDLALVRLILICLLFKFVSVLTLAYGLCWYCVGLLVCCFWGDFVGFG